MDKLKLIIAREYLNKVRNKTFIIMTFLGPLLMVGMIVLVSFITKTSMEKKRVVSYIDHSELFAAEDFENTKSLDFINISNLDLETAKNTIKDSEQYGLLYIPKGETIEEVASNIAFYSSESPSVVFTEKLERRFNKKLSNLKMIELNIDIQQVDASRIESELQLTNFEGEESSKFINSIKLGIGSIAGYMIMLFILVYGAMVMRSVIEEKTSRIIEIIVSSVKPFQLMLGKIIGTAAAGLTQFLIWAIVMMIIFTVSSMMFGVNMAPSGISAQQMEQLAQNDTQFIITELLNLPLLGMFVYFILYFLLGYLLYSSIYAAIGAAVDNETDTQQFMLPVMLPLMIGVYVGFATVINDPHGSIATIFSMIPFTSPIVMLMRIPFGVPWWQIALSLFFLLITFLFVVWLAAKIYRVGILMYGKKISYRELYKWLRY